MGGCPRPKGLASNHALGIPSFARANVVLPSVASATCRLSSRRSTGARTCPSSRCAPPLDAAARRRTDQPDKRSSEPLKGAIHSV